jgi:hypothetical protein
MPTIEDIQTQVRDYQAKALEYVKSIETTVVEYVGKAAGAVADRVPAEQPLVAQFVDNATFQAGFAKKVLDSQNAFAKKLIDASVKPFAPARKRTVRAA